MILSKAESDGLEQWKVFEEPDTITSLLHDTGRSLQHITAQGCGPLAATAWRIVAYLSQMGNPPPNPILCMDIYAHNLIIAQQVLQKLTSRHYADIYDFFDFFVLRQDSHGKIHELRNCDVVLIPAFATAEPQNRMRLLETVAKSMPPGGFIVVKSAIGNQEVMFLTLNERLMEGMMGLVKRRSIDKGNYWSLISEVVIGRMERRSSF